MGLEIHTIQRQEREENEAAMALYSAPDKLWLTAERDRVVPDGHPDAAFLFLAKGDEISAEEAAKFGLKTGEAPADKKGSKPADKTGAKPAVKAAGGSEE